MWTHLDKDLQSGYRYAFSLTHCREDAEDLVQQAALKLHRHYGKSANRRLLFVTIRNLFRDQMRKKNLLEFESTESYPDNLKIDEKASPATNLDVAEALGRLKPTEREILFLHFIEGYTAREIGEFVAIPRGTVLSHIHRAVRKLRKELQTDDVSANTQS